MNSFFVDECLTPELVAVANARGYAATHVIYLERNGTEDWVIAQLVLSRNDILVTNNAHDFLAIYARLEIHPGLVIILPSVDLDVQVRLFEIAVNEIERREDIVNQVLSVERDGSMRVFPWSVFERPPKDK
jgi:predicted nuclease of predicted toxin-antitoxin system